jgi:Co/Zn/Cd efflux system component
MSLHHGGHGHHDGHSRVRCPTWGVALLPYAYREGAPTCAACGSSTRNDAVGNVAVLLAASGVCGTGTRWPDLLVAAVMAGLALSAGLGVVRQARRELVSKGAWISAGCARR